MWLLSTDRAELHFFYSPDAVDGGYAILSHTWSSDGEQSYDDIRRISAQCMSTGASPRDHVSDKIRECCQVAERDGYEFVWIDTCCIDKSSSTELSEAINSMFRWYASSEVCYAYLQDVPEDCDVHAAGSAFRTARWHTRGWTLQELIAPSNVVFLSSNWKVLGSKLELAQLLREITSIWPGVLTHEASYLSVSIAQRMWWASKRSTTRIEDEAYCLMGIFDVNLPTIYGEGRQAFQRLQLEIMRKQSDSSLFAWGPWTVTENLEMLPYRETLRLSRTTFKNDSFLLATSPQKFSSQFDNKVVRYTPNARNMLQPYLPGQFTPPSRTSSIDGSFQTSKDAPCSGPCLPRVPGYAGPNPGPFGDLDLPRFSETSYGVHARMPIAEVPGTDGRLVIAVLLCDNYVSHIGLLLHHADNNFQDQSRRQYKVGYAFQNPDGSPTFVRLVSLGPDFRPNRIKFNGKAIYPAWRDVFILHAPPPWELQPFDCSAPLNYLCPIPPFRMPQWLVGRLGRLDFEPHPPVVHHRPADGGAVCVSLTFGDPQRKEGVRLVLGTCDTPPTTCAPSAAPALGPHWARAIPLADANYDAQPASDREHDCATDHVAAWGAAAAREFRHGPRVVRLSFSPDPRAPGATLVLNVELGGSVYAPMLLKANVRLPPPRGLEALLNEECVGRIEGEHGYGASGKAHASFDSRAEKEVAVTAPERRVIAVPCSSEGYNVITPTDHSDFDLQQVSKEELQSAHKKTFREPLIRGLIFL